MDFGNGAKLGTLGVMLRYSEALPDFTITAGTFIPTLKMFP
jgi:hypothetical protein